ncbi:hypothetical protein BAMA_15615 [Bacillus manliponensis]|uniref:Pyrrolo-quinoline quinone repeat domain-containing protein n=1 Tax=Bacillus manliponensis TaxID=574376 RepID=A0A073JQN3_9BACI|nr:PQQ-binding-like beta-propeller repeat protein [Bacillus manliponensis]KEK17379.1 hypothetical protein BAMA_15615 [Bacillus manliponensis]
MKKKFMFMLLLFVMIVGSIPLSVATAQSTNTQGEQFEKGKYDLTAEAPFGQNWDKNSPYVGTDVTKVKWEHKVYYKDENGHGIKRFYAQPAVGKDGTVYVGNQNRKLYAFNKDGSIKWTKDDIAYMYASPVIAEDGTIYIAGIKLTALHPDGSIKWQVENTNAQSTPVIDNEGVIYIHNRNAHRIEAYNPDGSIKWVSKKLFRGNINSGSMLISKNETIYSLSAEGETGYLYAHDKAGNLLWEKKFKSTGGFSFTLGLNNEILVNLYNNLYVLDQNGNIIQEIKAETPFHAAPTVSSTDGTIYIASDGYLYAYKPDYTLKWKYYAGFGSRMMDSPVIDKNGVIYVKTSFKMFAVNPDGTLKWSMPNSPSQFSAGGITIGQDGTLYTAGDNHLPNYKTYYSIMAIGDPYEDKFCTRESTYMEVLKTLESKSKKAKLTEEEKKEAREILMQLSGQLDSPEQ